MTRARRCRHAGRLLPLLLLAALALPRPAAAQQLTLAADDERPLRGQAVRLTVLDEDGRPAAGTRVSALYRPNSHTEHRVELPDVDSSGTVVWTPEYTGPVTLEVRPAAAVGEEGARAAAAEAGSAAPPLEPAAASLTVAVRYGSLPASGLIIMVLAGILLFGGAAVSMILLIRPGHIPPSEPPST